MNSLDEITLRIVAANCGEALRCTDHLKVAMQPHAIILVTIRTADEGTNIQAVAYGHVGDEPTVRVAPDTRHREDTRLLEDLGAFVDEYFVQCREMGDWPQIWVSSRATVAHLEVLADYLSAARSTERVVYRDAAALVRLGHLLTYAVDRFPYDDQQLLQVAPLSLTRHWVTGQQPSEDEHLGAVRAFIQPPVGMSGIAAAMQAERRPMGARTPPDFDERLILHVDRYARARSAQATAAALASLELPIFEMVAEEIVRPIYSELQQAVALLQGLDLPRLPGLDAREDFERKEFLRVMARIDRGRRPWRDASPIGAARELALREQAAETVHRAEILEDGVARIGAILDGELLAGELIDVTVQPRRQMLRPRSAAKIIDTAG